MVLEIDFSIALFLIKRSFLVWPEDPSEFINSTTRDCLANTTGATWMLATFATANAGFNLFLSFLANVFAAFEDAILVS